MASTNTSQDDQEPKKEAAPIPITQLPRQFVSRRWWWASILVVAGMAITFRLGVWQLDRLEQRRVRNAEYVAKIDASPLRLDGVPLEAGSDDLRDRPAVAQGTFDFTEQVILVQQNYEGRPGAHLVAPFVIDGSERAVLVDRGWIPAGEVEAGNLDRFNSPDQEIVYGSLQSSQELSGGRQASVTAPQEAWYRIDIGALQNQVSYELLPVYLLETPTDEIQEKLPYKAAPDIDLTDGPHLGYAIQWFLFCTLLAVGYANFVRTRSSP